MKTPVPEFLFLINFNGLRPATLLKKTLWHRYFPVNFTKFLRTTSFIEHLWWLLLTPATHIVHSRVRMRLEHSAEHAKVCLVVSADTMNKIHVGTYAV